MSNVMAATFDKQFVYLDLAIQYKLEPASLIDLFTERQQAYDSFYRREAEQALKDVCVQWQTIPDFYVKRTEIALQMENSIKAILEVNHAELVAFQLRGITLQGATESKIIETLVAEQEEITEGIIQTTTVVRAQKEQFKTAAEAEVKVINSEANAKGIEISSQAEAKAFKLVTDAQSSKLSKLEDTLSLANPQRLLTYLWYTGLGGTVRDKTNVKIGVDSISQSKLTS
jgi:regulator of protease activity HflC (stomatin/prohibitin superfamily)